MSPCTNIVVNPIFLSDSLVSFPKGISNRNPGVNTIKAIRGTRRETMYFTFCDWKSIFILLTKFKINIEFYRFIFNNKNSQEV